jgi:hypothetical protein
VLPGGAITVGRPSKKGWARVFHSWCPSNDIAKFDRLKAVGNEVRWSGRWSHTDTPTGGAPSNREGIFPWIMVRDGELGVSDCSLGGSNQMGTGQILTRKSTRQLRSGWSVVTVDLSPTNGIPN